MKYVGCLLLLIVNIAHADTRAKVAVIDTGISDLALYNGYFCKDGNKDFSGTDLRDRHGHGSMIAREIEKNIDKALTCIVVVKWIDLPRQDRISADRKLNQLVQSINYAVSIGVKYINLSLGGDLPNEKERLAISRALSKGIVVAVAAGNEAHDLSLDCNYFPACYPFKNENFIVVANYNGVVRQPTSNYGGPVNAYEYGPSGTSESTAIHLGKIIRGNYENKCTNTCPYPIRVR